MNNISVTGRICGAVDYIYTQKGDLRSSFVIADNAFGDAQFVKCVSFNERVNEKLKNYDKGYLVDISGKMQIKKFGEKYYTTIQVREISLLSKKYKPVEPDDITGGVLPDSSPPQNYDLDFEDIPF